MEFHINVEKKYFFGILTAILMVAGLFAVYAYGTNEPEVFGHSVGEVDIKLDCAYAHRFVNEEPLVRVRSGNSDAFEAIGMGESGNNSANWGLGCTNGYQKTSCSVWLTDGGQAEPRYDTFAREDGNNCLTDNEEFDSGAVVEVGCCKIGAAD